MVNDQSSLFDPPVCPHCGGDASSPNHWLVCDGRQGQIEAEAEAAAPEPAAPQSTIAGTRETSIQAFYNAVDSGIIETRRQQVWMGLRAIGIATAHEVLEYLKDQHLPGLAQVTSNNLRTRFTELRDRGLVREVGERPCRITGRTCITWEIVPPDQYVGETTVHRCPQCNQIVSRDIPISDPERVAS